MLFPYLPWNGPDGTDSEHAAGQPDLPAVRDRHREWTRRELTGRARAVAARLHALGVRRGDVVAVMLPNCTEFLAAMFGAWYLGAVVTPVNPVFTDTEAARQLTDSGAGVLVCTEPGRFDDLTTVLDAAEIAGLPDPGGASDAPADPAPLSGEDTALVVYTSGSTGRPKGAMLGHAQLDAMTAAMTERTGITGDDHCILVLPLFHVNAILVSVLTPMRVGAGITMVERFAPRPFLELVETHRPTYFSCVPTILSHITDLPLEDRPDTGSLRFVICGAAPASPELLVRAEDQLGITVVEGYGLTEGTCANACNPVAGPCKVGTVGPAMPGQTIRIVDEAGADVPTGTAGKVLISGPTVMQGYLNRPAATAETVVDGWLHTGDVGSLDEDGYLTIIDRIKDMIIRGGENIYPKEIEALLYGVDGVLEAAVIARPHPRLGEEPVAVVSLMQGSPLTTDELLAHCRRHLTKIKVPVDLQIVDEIPKNPVGKIDKPTLRAGLTTTV